VLSSLALAAGANAQSTVRSVACAPDNVVAIQPSSIALPNDSASADVTHFSFLVYGDTRGARDGKRIQSRHKQVIESMLGTIQSLADGPAPVRFVLQSGDAVTDGSSTAQWNASYSPLINRLTTEGGVSYFSAVGNHDVSSAQEVDAPERVPGLCNYLAATARLIPAEGAPHRLAGYAAFAFGFGQWFFLTFDSNIADDDIQFDWVRAELEGLDRQRFPNVAILIHHPPFSSGPHGGARVERPAQALRGAYMPLFRFHHVRLLLTGHEHLFEHWIERYVDSTGTHRIDEIVSGGGGAPAYKFTREPDLGSYIKVGADEQVTVQHLIAPSPRSSANPLHYVVVDVNGAEVSVRVVGVGSGRDFAPYGRASLILADPPGGNQPGRSGR
jgi:hypothetical protein